MTTLFEEKNTKESLMGENSMRMALHKHSKLKGIVTTTTAAAATEITTTSSTATSKPETRTTTAAATTTEHSHV